MSILAQVVYFQDAQVTKSITFGARGNDTLVVQPHWSQVRITCSHCIEAAGTQGFAVNPDFEMVITNSYRIPILNQDFTPVLDSDGNPETIGEFDFWKEMFWDNIPPVTMKAALEAAIWRKLEILGFIDSIPDEITPLVKIV